MKLIVGLGNPDAKYALNRHNIGWWVVDAVAREYGFGAWQSKFQGVIAKGKVNGEDVLLLKPHTYMNNSGQSVRAAADFYKLGAEDILVIHDELDLEPLDVRQKTGGGHAGHNGLKSIMAHLGTRDFARLRIGIGHPGDKNLVSPYVLSDFSKAEAEKFADLAVELARDISF